MPANSSLKFIGLILVLVGIAFILLNFLSPHTSLVQASVQIPHQVSVPTERQLGSKSDFTLESNHYQYFYGVRITAGQTFKMTWSSDTSLTAYIFTQNQFNNYQSNQLGFAINYQATGSGRTGTLTYDVKDSDDYVAMISNSGGLFGTGPSAQVYQLATSAISYTNQTEYTTQTQTVPQNDNLYLYPGFILIILGALVFFIPNRAVQQREVMPKAEKKARSNNVNYMIFALGALLIVVGIYLSTYTTVVMANQTISVFGFNMTFPQAGQVQPYLPIGIIVLVLASALIGLALYWTKHSV